MMQATPATDRRTDPSGFGILLVYALLTLAVLTGFGEFTWEGLAVLLLAVALTIALHVRPLWQRVPEEPLLLALLLGFLMIGITLSIGHTLERVQRTYVLSDQVKPFVRYALPGMLIRLTLIVSLVAAGTYLLPDPSGNSRWRRGRFAALLAAALAARVLLIIATPDPKIDVHVLQQQGAEALWEGRNPYAMEFDSPYQSGAKFTQYCYPPGVAYVGSVAWLLFREVRWAWLICDVLGGVAMYLLARRMRPGADHARFHELVALVFLFMPRSLYVIEKAWTEPLCAALMGALALAMASGKRWGWCGILAGLWLTSKQYVVVAIPALIRLRRWPMKAAAGAVVAAALVFLPFMAWDFGALYDDVVRFFLHSAARPDALSLYGLACRYGGEIPWGLLALLWGGGVIFFTLRMRRSLAGWLFGTAAIWLWFFLFGKQAAMNYFYLIGYALLLAVAASPASSESGAREAR